MLHASGILIYGRHEPHLSIKFSTLISSNLVDITAGHPVWIRLCVTLGCPGLFLTREELMDVIYTNYAWLKGRLW